MERENFQLKRLKLKGDDRLFAEVDYDLIVNDGTQFIQADSTARTHYDLRKAMSDLNRHLALMCEQYNTQGQLDTERVRCVGFTLFDSKGREGIKLIGHRILSTKEILTINAPNLFWDDDSQTPYPYIRELAEIVEVLKAEAYEYVYLNKHEPEPQADMFDEAKNQQIMEQQGIGEDGKKKRSRKSKADQIAEAAADSLPDTAGNLEEEDSI